MGTVAIEARLGTCPLLSNGELSGGEFGNAIDHPVYFLFLFLVCLVVQEGRLFLGDAPRLSRGLVVHAAMGVGGMAVVLR